MPNAPTEMYYGCIVAINTTTYFFAQGMGTSSNDVGTTYFYNFETGTLTSGPRLNTGVNSINILRQPFLYENDHCATFL